MLLKEAPAASLPQELPLSMLQGMADDKAERLMELDIDSCQKLATENPIGMWLGTTYNLGIVVDWVSQAQLCVLFGGDRLEPLVDGAATRTEATPSPYEAARRKLILIYEIN